MNILLYALLALLANPITFIDADDGGAVNYLLKTNALNYQDNFEIDSEVHGHCISGTPESNLKADAQTTRYDEKCKELGPCHIGFTQAGEWVAYDFFHSEKDIAYTDYEGFPVIFVNITVRVAAPGPRNINLEIANDGNELGPVTTKTVYGKGYHDFEDVVWENVQLEPYNPHRLWIFFPAGNTNLCSVIISSHVAVRPIPFAINALDYDSSFEYGKDIRGNCKEGQPPIEEPDAQTTTTDDSCKALGPCHIAFTQPQEYVVYDFAHSNDWIVNTKEGIDKVFVDITVRVASEKPKLFSIELEYDGIIAASQYFWSIGLGWQVFQDVTFRMVALDPSEDVHSVIVRFGEGFVNLCSISVDYSKQEPPVTWGALEYSYGYRTYPGVWGQCVNLGDGVAVYSNSDSICLDRDGSSCRVTTAGPAPYLEYHFYVRSDEDFDIWVRAAAQYPGTTLRMELRPAGEETYSKVFEVIAEGLEDFKDIVWENLYLEENEYELRLYLHDSQTICSVAVKDSTSRHIVHVPGTYSAIFYADASDSTKQVIGNCPYVNDPYTGVDALVVEDPVCASAISEHKVACAVGWTDENEKISYRFKTDGVHEYINLSFRVASRSKNRRMQVDFYSTDPSQYIIQGPGNGWDKYETVTFKNLYVGKLMYHDIFITFLDGQMNLCSFGVEYAK